MNSVPAKPSSQVTGQHLGLGIALTLVGAVCWGFSGTCAQFLFSGYGLDPRWVVCVRSTVAGLFFLLLAVAVDRKRLVAVLTSPRALLSMFAFGVLGVLLCQVCYLFTIEASDAGTATVLQSLNLLIILAVVCFQLHRRPTRKEYIGVGLALVGTFLVATHGSFTSLAISPSTLCWGLATAVGCALYTLLPGRLLAEYGSIVTTGVAMTMAGVVSGALFRPWSLSAELDVTGLLFMGAIVVVGTIVSYLCYLNGVKLVGSMLAGLLGCAEPVTACVLSAVWLGTAFVPVDIVGMGMIIAMMFLMA